MAQQEGEKMMSNNRRAKLSFCAFLIAGGAL
jgi:hypothetical protein